MTPPFRPPGPAALRELLRAMVGRRVTVVGDAMLDAYLFGRVRRISPEAPVPVFEIEKEQRLLGGAANVAKCLVALGARVRLCGCVGRDDAGDVFLAEARGLGVDCSGVLRDAHRPTTLKTRVVAHSQQMLRLDREETVPLSPALERRLAGRVRRAVCASDAVILSDYAKGTLTPAICRAALQAADGRPVVVDPKQPPWDRFAGATVIKPNQREASAFAGREVGTEEEAEAVARDILRTVRARHVLLTRGAQGLLLVSRGDAPRGRAKALRLPSHPREVFDVTGAGDVVGAVFTLAFAAGAEPCTAAWLANVAAEIKVAKFGAAAVTDQEILESQTGGTPGSERKVLTRAQAAARAAEWRRQGRKIVFTNGCFDILHYGHVSYLERSRRLGDVLLVGVNSDASVQRLKGPGRPVQPEHDRLRILAGQESVDAVILFDEDTPRELIRAIRPDVLCKGADYKRKQDVVGWDLVESWGGRVALVELIGGRSTTGVLNRALRAE